MAFVSPFTSASSSSTLSTSNSSSPISSTSSCENQPLASVLLFLPVDEKGFTFEADRDAAFRRMRQKLENRCCIDCSTRNPTWLSVSFGVFLCLNCSGKHRRMGTHVSFVRSAEMDKFTKIQLLRMELGGNSQAHAFFREHGIVDGRHVDYHSKVAQKYKQHLDRLVQSTCTEFQKEGFEGMSSPTQSSSCSDSSSPPSSSSHPSLCSSPPSSLSTSSSPLSTSSSSLSTSSSPSPLSTPPISTPPISTPPLASSFSRTKAAPPSTVKAKKLDCDFDFDFVERQSAAQNAIAMNSQPSKSSNSPRKATYSSVTATNSAPTTSFSSNRFGHAKAISSERFFSNEGEEAWIDGRESVERFKSKNAISSAAFFNEIDRTANGMSLEDTTAFQLENLRDTARDRISAIASAGSEAMVRLGNWMNS